MTKRSAVLLGVGIALVMTIGGACGEELTPEERLELDEYLAGVDEVLDDAAQEFESNDPLSGAEPLELPEMDAKVVRDALSWYASFWNGLADDLSRLQPPLVAADVHGDWLQGLRLAADANHAAAIGALTEEAMSFFDELEGIQEQACLEVQAIAYANDIPGDLDCQIISR